MSAQELIERVMTEHWDMISTRWLLRSRPRWGPMLPAPIPSHQPLNLLRRPHKPRRSVPRLVLDRRDVKISRMSMPRLHATPEFGGSFQCGIENLHDTFVAFTSRA